MFMEKHNFMVVFMYAVIVSIVLLICGQYGFAIIAFIGYTIYASINLFKELSYKSKWDKMLTPDINNELREVILCHITQRAKKIDNKTLKKFITDINNGLYTVSSETLTNIHSESLNESDGGYTYYLEFDNNGKLYYMSESRIHYFKVGDVMWRILTADHSTEVIKGEKGYNNLLSNIVTYR